MSDLATEKLKAKLLDLLLALLATAMPGVLLWFEDRLAPLVGQVQPKTIIRCITGLFLILAWSWFLIWRFRPRLWYDPKLHIYFDKRSGHPYCQPCWDSKKVLCHLGQEKRGWNCAVCNGFFPKQGVPSTFIKRSTEADPW